MTVGRPSRLGAIGVAAIVAFTTWASTTAEEGSPLALTPAQQEGPFYPLEIPADHDADLTKVEGSDEHAAGEVLVLDGVVLRVDGTPIEGAAVEIWQTDAYGVYLHPGDPDFAERDSAFQGFGEATSDVDGAWSFRTILPEVYGGRPRHIHAKVKVDDATVLTTQIYFSGGDIPSEGSIGESGTDLDALLVEVHAELDERGAEVLKARHLLVVP